MLREYKKLSYLLRIFLFSLKPLFMFSKLIESTLKQSGRYSWKQFLGRMIIKKIHYCPRLLLWTFENTGPILAYFFFPRRWFKVSLRNCSMTFSSTSFPVFCEATGWLLLQHVRWTWWKTDLYNTPPILIHTKFQPSNFPDLLCLIQWIFRLLTLWWVYHAKCKKN